jgi:CheY-like chemotaxis protein
MKKILLVDDSPSLVAAAYDELEDRGYLVEVAYDGLEALALLEEMSDDLPHLIIMDIEMPNMKGDKATRLIKQNQPWKDIPVVALTAVSPDHLGEALAYFDNYLVKPFGFEEMLALVERMIGAPD